VFNKATKILRDYFEGEEEEDAELAPAENAQGGQFVFGGQPAAGNGQVFNFGPRGQL
jgi:hypothetical protein